MKTNFCIRLGHLLPVISLLLVSSCNKKDSDCRKPAGKLNLTVGLAISSLELYNHPKAYDVTDFQVSIFNSENEIVEHYDKSGDIPEFIELEEGEYYAIASSANNTPAAFENPYYEGISDHFEITATKITALQVTCYLANVMVTVVYSENVKQQFSDYSTRVSGIQGSLVFGKNENRAGYFTVMSLEVKSTLSYIIDQNTMQNKILTGFIPNAQPRQHYEIFVDASLNSGDLLFSIKIQDSIRRIPLTMSDKESSVEQINYGDLIITEIMYNPDSLDDSQGEWLEIRNVSCSRFNLMGLIIRRSSNNSQHIITENVLLDPGAYAVLARSSLAAPNISYIYGSSISLPNSGEEITLCTKGNDTVPERIVCSVDYGASGFNTNLKGCSLQLDSLITGIEESKLGSNWCSSQVPFSTGDYGTPGIMNRNCND